jgi:hypothetical protein
VDFMINDIPHIGFVVPIVFYVRLTIVLIFLMLLIGLLVSLVFSLIEC